MKNWVDILENFYKEFKNYNYKTTLSIKTFEEYNKFIKNNNINSFIDNLKEKGLFIVNEMIMNFKYKFKPEYIEFQYALIYISNVIKDNLKNLTWNSGFSIDNLEYYVLSNFYLFIFSLLDKITTLNYIIKEKNLLNLKLKKLEQKKKQLS